jgi:ribonuclease VapC
MIVVNTSAVIAILEKEPERDQFNQLIGRSDTVLMLVVLAQEAAMVMYSCHGHAGLDQLWQFVNQSELQTLPFDGLQPQNAIGAFKRCGKGIHPKARYIAATYIDAGSTMHACHGASGSVMIV